MERLPKISVMRLGMGDRECGPCYDPYGHHRFQGRRGWRPDTDILETEDAVIILMDLAGVEKEDIRVAFHGEILHVSGLRKRREYRGVKRLHRMEVDYGPFQKLFRIPQALDPDRIQAVQRNGFLEVSIPKKETKEPSRVVIVHEEG